MNSRLYKYFVRPILGILGVLLCVVLLLHTSWGLNLMAQTALSRLQLFKDARLSVKSVEGRPFSRLSLHNIELVSDSNSTLAQIEHIQIGYQLMPILKGQFHLTDLVIDKPLLNMTQQKDLSWDLFNIVESDTSTSSLILSLNKLTLREGSIVVSTFSEQRDSTYQIRDLGIQLSQVYLSQGTLQDSLSGSLDNLEGKIWTPYTGTPVDLALTAAYDGESVLLDSLRMRSSKSYVDGRGRIFLSTADSLLYQNELTLTASPLAFDDIRLFLPALAPGASANIDFRINHGDQNLTSLANILLSDGARLYFDGSWDSGGTKGSNISARGNIQNFNPEILISNSGLSGLINADVAATLSGNNTKQLSGNSLITLYDSQLQGLPLDSTSIEGIFTNGRAQLSLLGGLHDADVSIAGAISPFEDFPDYKFEGNITSLNLAPLLENNVSSHLNTTFKLEGRGFSSQEMDATLTLQMTPSNVNSFRISEGELLAHLDRGRLSHTLGITGTHGNIVSDGVAVVGSKTIIEHLNLTLDQFDLEALLGDTLAAGDPQSSITASTYIKGQVDAEGNVDATLKTDIKNATFKQFALTDASFSGAWQAEEITLTSAGQIQSGSYSFEGGIRLEETSTAYEITHADF